jgi:general secretion pathway protein I
VKHSLHKSSPRRPDSGFTLLEVLVALVIVSLGMIAVFSQLNQMLNTTSRLRDKTLAHWIAVDQITELQANRAYPSVGEKSDEVDMANATWSYTVKTSQIGDLDMRRVNVTVSFPDTPQDILAEVSGFIAPPQQAAAGGQPQQPGRPPGPQSRQTPGGPAQQPVQSLNPSGAAGTGFGKGWDPLNPNDYVSGGI